MKAITIIDGKTHPLVTAYLSSNNFGEQIILFRHEAINGKITECSFSFPEGEHIQSIKKLKALFNSCYSKVIKTVDGRGKPLGLHSNMFEAEKHLQHCIYHGFNAYIQTN